MASISKQTLKLPIGCVCVLLLGNTYAGRAVGYAEAPYLRVGQAEAARVAAEQDKRDALVWAGKRGVEARFDDGTETREIMAIQNGRPLIYTTQNDRAAISTAADRVRNTLPFGVDGSGLIAGVWDAGSALANHQEFGSRVLAKDGASANYHSTHVAGTIGASGVVARAEGMAPNVQIDSYDWSFDDSEMIQAAASYPGEAGKVYVSNHSYGILAGWFYASWLNPYTHRSGYHFWGDINAVSVEKYFGQYGAGPQGWDRVVYNAPYFLPFKAAGNERDDDPVPGATVYYTPDDGTTWSNTVFDPNIHPMGDGQYKGGYDTIPYLGTAKNIMTVGAVTDAVVDGDRDPSAADALGFTSWGPADDGRIKPDIVANGDALYSCNSSSASGYATLSGTSMACPNAAGSALLLADYYDDLFPGQAMRASTLKGLVIHTADDLGRPGPDYQYGWGLMNTRRAADLLAEYQLGNTTVLREGRLLEPNDTSYAFSAYVDGGEPLKVTLCWTDPPGTATDAHDDRIPVLVNDLDLRIIDPGGTVHYPFSLDYLNPEALATDYYKNALDNVEQVLIDMPQPGIYTIEVEAAVGLQDGEQWYSLVASGAESDSDGDGMPDSWEAGFFADTTNSLPTADPDGDGYDNMMEFIAGTDPTDQSSVFAITSTEPLTSGNGSPFVITWNSVPGRVYNVGWSYNLQYVPFTPISGDIRWPLNSYTDTVDRIGDGSMYRLDVRLDE